MDPQVKHDFVLGGESLVGEHGGKTSWGLHTSQDGSWSTPLYRNPSGVSAAVCSASSPSTDFLQD